MRISYRRALDDVLLPLGFQKDGNWKWTRREGGLMDQIYLQVSSFAGTTVNVHFDDGNTRALLDEAAPGFDMIYLTHRRLGELAGELRDTWWRKDPNGPLEATTMLKAYGLPFLERMHDLEFQITQMGPLHLDPTATLHMDRRRHVRSQAWLAMTLYRLGRFEDARRVINDPSKPLTENARDGLEKIRRWIEERTAGRSGPADA